VTITIGTCSGRRIVTQRAAQLYAIQMRHLEVTNDDVWNACAGERQATHNVGRHRTTRARPRRRGRRARESSQCQASVPMALMQL
jgi:hypothetical protein